MSRATVSGLHVGSNLVFCTCSLSVDPTSHITGVTVSHELFRMNPSEPFAPSYRGTVSLIYPDQLSPLPFCHILHQCTSTQVHRHTGTQRHRYANTLVHTYTGNPIHWYTGTAAYRYTSTPVHKYTNTLVYRYTSTLVHRYIGTQLRG